MNQIKRTLPPRWYVVTDDGKDLRWFYSRQEAERFLQGTKETIVKRKREVTYHVEDAPY